ncbi:MAG: hypothetical protein K0S41_2702 [Anaerocolumna sp.]|jgi:glycopeptide antibiotics resistance protein|nr:hypothetical protein [Anaerocolumna sp.]
MVMEILRNVIANILTALYQPFWFGLILSVLFMFVWKNYSSVKEAINNWNKWFRSDLRFRRMFLTVFYSVMILFRTLLNRSIWTNPVSDVIGVWGLHKLSNGEKVLTTEVLENLALFIPFTILLLWTYKEKIIGDVKLGRVLWQSVKIVLLFSLSIEMLQLFLRLGTWQLSDLFYNTLGGFIGGLIYWIGYKAKHRSDHIDKDAT